MQTGSSDVNDEDKYRIYSKVEIIAILNALMQGKSRITAYFNRGNDFFLTSIMHVDTEEECVVLDLGGDATVNEKALKSEKILMVTAHEKIRVQFTIHQLDKVNFNGYAAFKISLPTNLLRLQRREYYRLAISVTKPIKCSIALPSNNKKRIEVTIFDISLGGVAMIDYKEGITLSAGTIYPNCHIQLPEIGEVIATLEVKNSFEVEMKNGMKCKRVGCRFVNLTGSMLVMLQRYILEQERERKAKLIAGMDAPRAKPVVIP